MNNPDVIVVGAGHNGLVAANYLAKAGRSVLVLESRGAAGGQLVAAGASPAWVTDPLHAGGQLRPDIVRDLGLAGHGLGAAATAALTSALPDGGTLRLSADPGDARALESIRAVSARDATRWPEFVAFMQAGAAFLDAALATPMPRLSNEELRREAWPLARLGWKLRGLGKRDMFRFMRSLSMSAQELGEEWFESEAVRAAVGAVAIHGATLGAMSAGTGYTLLHNWLNRGGVAPSSPVGGPKRIADALVAALAAHGGTLRVDAPVARIRVDRQRIIGVTLASGEEISAGTVVSCADPRRTLLGLVGAAELPPEYVWGVQSIRMRGSLAKVHVLTDGRHGLPEGTTVIAPSLRYLERAYDASKYGEISQAPMLEVTTSGAALAIHFQFASHSLRGSDWSRERGTLERIALDTLAARFPGLRDSVKETHTITPLDLERDYGLTEGDLNHGQPILDQLLFMRPMPGWSDHRTPVDGLYLGGSGTHGGIGIGGAAGRNAARRVLAGPTTG